MVVMVILVMWMVVGLVVVVLVRMAEPVLLIVSVVILKCNV